MSQTPEYRLNKDEYTALSERLDNASRWPGSDGLAALNTITAEKRLAASKLVTEGLVVSCAHPPREYVEGSVVEEPGSGPHPYKLSQWYAARDGWHAMNDRLEIDLHGFYGMTHLDSLGHFFNNDIGFGGTQRPELGDRDTSVLPVEAGSAGIVTRGVLIDVPRARGRALDPGEPISLASVKDALAKQGSTPEPGDALIFRFGPPSGQNKSLADPHPGVSIECAEWVHEQDCSMIVTDAGMDVRPSQVDGVGNPWHLILLTRMGIRLLDRGNLEALSETCARLSRWEFQFIVAPLPVPGASGIPVNPLALF